MTTDLDTTKSALAVAQQQACSVIGRCGTCKHWREKAPIIACWWKFEGPKTTPPIIVRVGECASGKIVDADTAECAEDGLSSVARYDECFVTVIVGVNFGCVHYSPNDDKLSHGGDSEQ